jgi:ATP-dependent RNA helicase SUPV3L1/SUV3
VRVDILERLADLIRPALAWRESSPGEKPAGAFDGRSFVVTQAMTSLTGSAGEDFASVLRALGYRMERRAPLPPKPVVVEAVEAAPAETVADDSALIEISMADIVDQQVSGDPAPSAALLPAAEVAPEPAVEAAPEPVAEAAPEPVAAEEPHAAEAPAEQAAAEATASEATASEVTASETTEPAAVSEAAPAEAASAEAKPDTPAEPVMIDVWRPGGRSEERRPHHDRNRQRHHGRPQGDAQPAAAAGEGAEGAPRGEQRHRRPRRHSDFRKPQGAPADGAVAAVPTEGAPAATEARPERPRFEAKGRDRDKDKIGGDRPDRKFGGGDRSKGGDRNKGGGDRGARDKGRDFGGRDKGGRDKRDSGPSHRQWATTAAPRDRDRPADPNSPFAKLAALKEQLAGRKD